MLVKNSVSSQSNWLLDSKYQILRLHDKKSYTVNSWLTTSMGPSMLPQYSWFPSSLSTPFSFFWGFFLCQFLKHWHSQVFCPTCPTLQTLCMSSLIPMGSIVKYYWRFPNLEIHFPDIQTQTSMSNSLPDLFLDIST